MTIRRRIQRLEQRTATRGPVTPKVVELMTDAELLDGINRGRVASGLPPFVGEPTKEELNAEIERLERRLHRPD